MKQFVSTLTNKALRVFGWITSIILFFYNLPDKKIARVITTYVTIISLIIAFVAYFQTVKPYIDKEKLETQISLLQTNLNNKEDEIKILLNEIEYNNGLNEELLLDNSKIQQRNDELSNDILIQEERLDALEDDLVLAYADVIWGRLLILF